MTGIPVRLIIAGLLALVIVACAPQTEVIKLHDETASAGDGFSHFLVVAVAGDSGSRREFENLITARVRDAGATATAAHTKTGSKTTLLQEEIDSAARETGADAILVTHIVSVDTTAEAQEGRTDVLAECRGGDPEDYFLYDYEELKEPDSVRIAHTVVAVTNLYEAASGSRLWTIQSTCFEKATMGEVFSDEAEAIARQLRIDKLIG
jgi:hypothetical protein